MKFYRVWEANRKVWLYAESYSEEALRDNKTPIFEEMAAELLQDELNDPNAERAFRHYLEKLDQVAKLIVCGTCIDSYRRTLHVFGRTSTAPFAYFHRELNRSRSFAWTEGIWSPWQKLPVDVQAIDDGENTGVHMLPITWNRRLYLFWLVFELKPQKDTNDALPQGFDQIECWHIKLAWSEYKDGRWSPKQTGVPFAVSPSEIEDCRSISYDRKIFGPDHATQTTTEYVWTPWGWVITDQYSEPITKPHLITDGEDPMLSGTLIQKDGEWALHDHEAKTINVRSLLPKPADHFLDAQINGSELTLRVFCRFKGIPKGQGRKTTKDSIAVVRDGRRTDRTEQSQDDYQSVGTLKKFYKQVGTFHFPACRSDIDGSTALTSFNYENLVRPQDTTNSFMALRDDWPRVSGLRLVSGAAPILKWVPNRFEVIDADNRVGFERLGPFFYQDQQRCYLVTRESLRQLFKVGIAERPDLKVLAAQRAVGLLTVAEGHMGIAADAPLRANSWAQSALVKWSAGPGLPAGLSAEAPVPIHTLSGPGVAQNLAVSNVMKDLFAWSGPSPGGEYFFTVHWHPYICPFMASLNSGGLDALFTLDNQSLTDVETITTPGPGGIPILIGSTTNFQTIYKPDPAQVARPYPTEIVDFERNGSYSIYNWEIFFHGPLLMATRLSDEGRHEEALRWFHFVFYPMTDDTKGGDRRVWRFLPFRTADVMRVQETAHLLSYTGTDPAKLKQKAEIQALVQEWIQNPFKPHVMARRRPVVYMKHIFMKYLDNLIAWADELFQRDTMESINEAIQLYVLAANLLGPKPERVPAPGPVAPETYQSLRGRLDVLSNALVDLETRLPFVQLVPPATGTTGLLSKLPQTLYFCLPQNDRMLAYWDTIADRLFKIRHCMNIEGIVRQLPLFEPPIEPMLLVEAVAHGLDIGSVLNDLYAPLPRFRFTFMLQQALSMCAEVRSLGNTLLGVLEKRDTEKLALVRAEQETRLLDQVKLNKKLQIDEAEETRQSLENGAQVASAKIQYYENLIAQGLISEETDQLDSLDHSNERQETASWIEATAQMLNLIPNISVGSDGITSVSFGGSNVGASATAVARSYTYLAGSYSYKANRSSITGAHNRRADEWRFQRDLAKRELKQIERQMAAAQIRKEIAEADLRNHETQIEHARSIEELLRNKFTGESLYGWMEGTLRTIYFKCYQAAYEVAKRAERCWRYERGADASFVKFGAWDSSMRGLLSGERLYLQLKQMERAYLEQQVREFEITKHISLVQLDPLALIALKESGVSEVDVPEWLFDLDYPGHYFRRLKTVSITIPAVVGPYTSLNATLTLLNSKVRTSGRIPGTYDDDENYRIDHLAVEAIAASAAQNDSGRFELDFRGEKYLPFEGAGAISRWRIELPRKFRSFDYDTISDVVLHLKYTARRDETLSGPALAALQTELDAAGGGTLFRLFSLRHEFPSEWQAMLKATTHAATFTIAKDRFPLLVQGGSVNVVELHYALILKEPRPAVGYKAVLTPGAGAPVNLDWPGQPGRYRSDAQAVSIPITLLPADSAWQVQITTPVAATDLEKIQDILIVARYSVAM